MNQPNPTKDPTLRGAVPILTPAQKVELHARKFQELLGAMQFEISAFFQTMGGMPGTFGDALVCRHAEMSMYARQCIGVAQQHIADELASDEGEMSMYARQCIADELASDEGAEMTPQPDLDLPSNDNGAEVDELTSGPNRIASVLPPGEES